MRLEFWIACVGCATVGVLFLRTGIAWELICGTSLCGVTANYLALALHAESLLRAARLDEELAYADLAVEVRRAAVTQLWLLVPLVVAAVASFEWLGSARA